jgi:hypothetical protein
VSPGAPEQRVRHEDLIQSATTNIESHIDLNAANKHKVTVAEVRHREQVPKTPC